MPSADSYDATYFQALYGKHPGQTWADRLRDRLVERLVRSWAAPLPRSENALLDIGCGYGYLLEHFRDRFTLYGTDISPHAVAQAQARLPYARIAVADVQEGLPFPGPFQVILAINVLEHLASPESAIRVIYKHLAPGGLLVVHLPTVNNYLNRWLYGLSYARDKTHVYCTSSRDLCALLGAAGFRMLWESFAPHWPAALWNWLKPAPAYLAAFRHP